MSEMRKWAERVTTEALGLGDAEWEVERLARAILADADASSAEQPTERRFVRDVRTALEIGRRADTEPASQERDEDVAKIHDSFRTMQDDMADLLRALGLGDHARTASPHAVMQTEVLPAIARLRSGSEGSANNVDALRLVRKYLLRRARGTGTVSLAQIEASIHEACFDASDAAASPSGGEGALRFDEVQSRSEAFLRRMGWWKVKTTLESVALVASEVGEAANECRSDEPTAHFREEVADIVLRCFGIAAEEGFDLGAACRAKMAKWGQLQPGHKGRAK